MMNNFGFDRKPSVTSVTETERSMVQAEINMINATADAVIPLGIWCSKWRKFWDNYEWRMRHYFYIHLSVFFCNTLLCGVIIWNIEQQRVSYLDCWFSSATCVFTCGLETYDFGSYSLASQIVLLIFTVISGITVSTLPAIFIKIYRVKREITPDEETLSSTINDNSLPITKLVRINSTDPILDQRLRLLPSPKDLRTTAYIILIILILSTCFAIYLISFLTISMWLKYHYDPQFLRQDNRTVDPFYASIVITLTGFNQNGLSLWYRI
ncbi:unnamed protein product [Rotaria sp. Silwood1]|nr:unnamed protein product [Rotaria sp. Silwood1]CAF1135059.1 unnamed protein product [Rotaria sp. Silwood1]CAF3446444.1 unnamed protein product [Rotaria sp. Silwood1]CAF3473278.1 unnamed protein product [Rotaria sp. Silwood1]CAF4630797.1 unnamed protein product [Rotaria sp. Silwood1]